MKNDFGIDTEAMHARHELIADAARVHALTMTGQRTHVSGKMRCPACNVGVLDYYVKNTLGVAAGCSTEGCCTYFSEYSSGAEEDRVPIDWTGKRYKVVIDQSLTEAERAFSLEDNLRHRWPKLT